MKHRGRCIAGGCFKNTKDIHSFMCEFHYDLVPKKIRSAMAFYYSKNDFVSWKEFANEAIKLVRDFEKKRQKNSAFFIGGII